MTVYYLRRLIEKKQDQLTWKNPQSTDLVTWSNIREYLETQRSEASGKLDTLNHFIFLHQSFASAYSEASVQVQNIEAKIYECLELNWAHSFEQVKYESLSSFQLSSLTPRQELIQKLNAIRQRSITLLGPKITLKFFIETRPENKWCQLFTLSETHPISFDGIVSMTLSKEQSIICEQWISRFTEKCLEIIADFNQSEEKQGSQALFSDLLV